MLPTFRTLVCSNSWLSLGQQARVLATALDKIVVENAPAFAFQQQLPFSAASGAHGQIFNIPAGHINSDLSSSACHIGLGRRRDLTLRQDLRLHSPVAQHTLAEVFKGKKVMVVGFPGGKVCTEKHLPGFVQAATSLRQKGVDRVICVSVGDPSELENALKTAGLTLDNMFQVYQDKNGGLVRLLGLDLGDPDCGQGAKCQRYAAVVEDGILLKLCVEKSPKDLQITDANSMSKLWEKIYC